MNNDKKLKLLLWILIMSNLMSGFWAYFSKLAVHARRSNIYALLSQGKIELSISERLQLDAYLSSISNHFTLFEIQAVICVSICSYLLFTRTRLTTKPL